MEGAFNQTEFFTAMRSLSYHKRQGVLELSTDGQKLEILVLDGQIVEVRDQSRPLAVSIVAKLKVAGLLSENVARAYIKSPVTVGELLDALVGGGVVSDEAFRKAKRSYEIDRLMSVRNFTGGEFKFHPKVIRLAHDCSLDLSPGHLMLDIVEMNMGEEVFSARFGSISDLQTFLVRQDSSTVPVLIGEEAYLLSAISEEGTCFKAIYNATMLSEKELRLLVSDLVERELLVVDAPHLAPFEQASSVESEQIFFKAEETVDDYISSAAAELGGGSAEEMVVFLGDDGELIEATDAEARIALGDKYPERLVGDAASRAKKNEAWREWAAEGRESLADSLSDRPNVSLFGRLHNAVIYLNYKLLQPNAFEISSVLVVLCFFGILALFAPSFLETWLSSVQEFSASISG